MTTISIAAKPVPAQGAQVHPLLPQDAFHLALAGPVPGPGFHPHGLYVGRVGQADVGLADLERQYHGMSRRSDIYKKIDRIFNKEWRSIEEIIN